MKIQDNNGVVLDRNGLATNNEFTMQFNAKMAKILSDGLYADKVQSIIRELSCNAVDSHVASGQPDRPIEVHLPTSWEPWFYVRDFGTGLDHDEILSSFTRYGASTKTHSNEFMGVLGLGCKSPFSYVDAFDVTSVKNGVRRQYSMYKNEEGMPSVALLDQRDTDETNRVTVKMPVKASDYSDFANKAVRVYRWFNVKPTVIGRSDLNMAQQSTLMCGTDWHLYKLAEHTHMPPMAVMGLVAYPIEKDIIANLSDKHRNLLNMPLSMKFDIGDLEISASREALGYDPRTQAAIRNKLNHVYDELKVHIENQFKSATTLWHAKKIWCDLFDKYEYRFLKNLFALDGISWNGSPIKNPYIEVQENVCELRFWKTRNNGGTLKMVNQAAIKPGRGDTVIINDEGNSNSRVKLYCEANDTSTSTIWYFNHLKNITVEQLIEKLGKAPCIFTSQLPAAARKPRQINIAQMAEITKDKVIAVDIDMNLGGIYVELNNRQASHNNVSFDLDKLHAVRMLCINAGILTDTQTIYAPRRSMKTKIKELANWTNLFDLIAEKIKTNLTTDKLQNLSDTEAFHQHYRGLQTGATWKEIGIPDHADSPMSKFILAMRHMESAVSASAKDIHLLDIAKHLQTVPALPAPTFDVPNMEKVLVQTYPMLRMALDHYYGSRRTKQDLRNMLEYVNLIDTHLHAVAHKGANTLIASLDETA
jgi:hypothetical protein